MMLTGCLLCGCGGPKYYSVTGTVTVEGEPQGNIQVNFLPDDAALPTASGITDSDGWFELYSGSNPVKGAQAGTYKVVFITLQGDGAGPGGRGGRGGRGGPGGGGGPGRGGRGGPDAGEGEDEMMNERPDARRAQPGELTLPPDMPAPTYALEYYYAETTPVSFEVNEDAKTKFDLATEVEQPAEESQP